MKRAIELTGIGASLLILTASMAMAADPAPVVTPPATMNVTGAQAPTLSVDIKPGEMGSWDFTTAIGNLIVDPGQAGAAPQTGAGHAAVTVDKGKLMVIQGTTYHLDALPPGTHTIEIGLYTNDGKLYAANGKPVTDQIMLRAGKPGGPMPVPYFPPQVYDLKIADNKVSGAADTIKATQGDLIEFRWTTDAPAELHMHGYDILAEVSPDSPVTMVFDADLAGRFSVEKHGKPEHNLVYLEVYPK